MPQVIGLPAIPGFASGNWRLERSQDVAVNPFGKTRQRTEFDGAVWRCALSCPKYNGDDAGVLEAWFDRVSRADNWLYVPPPQNELRGAWALPELVSNGTFEGGVTTGWAGTGATLSVNARRLKVKNSGAAIGYARQTLSVTADVPYVLLVDLYAGSTQNWRIRLLDGADAEEHFSYYAAPGRVPIVHIPASSTLKVELGCNTAVSGDDVKFGNVTAARCLLVKDSLAVGNELGVKGAPASTNAALKVGQFVTIRLWNGWQMVRLIEDFDSDANGEGTLKFEPALRDGVLGGGPVVMHAPFMRATLDAPVSESQLEAPSFKGIALDAVEDPTELVGEVPNDTDLIWYWDANSLGLAPTIGTGTPTLTADIDNWYVDSDGLLKQVAAANTPVFEFNPITKALKGQRIQSARTNLVWPSDDFSHANWVKSAGGTGSNPAIVPNDAIAPDGTTTADKITLNRGAGDTSSDGSFLVFNTGTTSSGVAHAGTMFLKGVAGQTVVIRHVGNAGYTVHAFTGGWDRFSVIETAGSTAPIFELADRGTFGSTRNVTFWAWRAQLEVGAFASSPIQTLTGTVARAAEVDTLALNLIPGFTASEYTIVGEVLLDVVEASAAEQRVAVSLDDGPNEQAYVRLPTAGNTFEFDVFDGGVRQALLAGATVVSGVPYRFAADAKVNDFGYSTGGAATATDTSGTMPAPITLRKGATHNSTAQTNGYHRRLSVYKKKPSRQIRSLSA